LALWIAGIAVYAAHSWVRQPDRRLYLADPVSFSVIWRSPAGAPSKPSCWVAPAPIKQLLVVEPDKIICPVDRGRN
jgi:hypothetical protein